MIFLFVAAATFAGCATAPTGPAAIPSVPRDAATAAAIEQVLAGAHRTPENAARDAYRHPLDTLLFFGIKPDMTVVEVWPGAAGWYTEILAPLLAAGGKLYDAQLPAAPGNEFVTKSLRSFGEKLGERPGLYGKVEVTTLGPSAEPIAPPGSVDMVVTFRNVHNWMNLGYAKEAFAAMFTALKPGGILGVVEHRGDSKKPQDPRASNGYVNEDYAIELIEAVGFKLVARSEINANAKDTKDYEQGVWTLPPNYRLGNRERAKYTAIGESDRFTLKFRKGAAPLSQQKGSALEKD
ncbi:MAG: methyltransferase [Pseudomonadota bacterium]